MPATEQTWRNQKTLHVAFGASALVMAIATVWMTSADHNREWKDWQLKDRKKDAWMTQSRRDVLADMYATQMEGYESEIRSYDSQPISRELIDQFEATVRSEDARLNGADAGEPASAGGEPANDASDAANKVTQIAYTTAAADDAQFAKLEAAVGELNAVTAPVLETDAELIKLKADLAKAKEAQTAAAATPPKPEEAEAAAKAAEELTAKITALEASMTDTQNKLTDAQDAAIAARGTVLAQFNDFIREARRRETSLVARKKSLNGQRTAKVSELGIKIGQSADPKLIDATQDEISKLDEQITRLTAGIAAAKEYRLGLEAIVAAAEAEKVAAAKELDAMNTELKRLDEQVYQNTSNVGEWVTRWPVLNALYSGNVRVEQNWLPDMTINYNFSQVARFDRCTTCHRAIAKTAPGTATDPQYPTIADADRDLTLQLLTPETKPAEGDLKQVYGMELSPEGIVVNEGDVTVHFVLPESAAARAGIQSGDVIREINGNPVYSPEEAEERLLSLVPFGSSVKIGIRRGLDHPFTAHPRLDLFLTDSSPHPMKDVGCTICHDGQGSGTSFPYTSHTPDNADEQNRWARDLGWFDNHHWIFPMKPKRFTESNCLKCHHDKGSLEPSERFPEPPAPQLVEGWSLVEDFGCFGCHEINGFDSPLVTVGPDVRLEPAYHEAAAQMLRNDALTDEQRSLVQDVMAQPTNADARNQLLTSLTAKPEGEVAAAIGEPSQDAAELQRLAGLLKGVETPGMYRKVGPSLRHIKSKVDYDWLYSWIRKPADFRPSTKMPQFFGLHEHLSDPEDADGLAESQKFEPIEIRALTEYLLNASSEFEYLKPAEGVTEQASAERGKWQFESRGCLACHSHEAFEGVTANQGPDLSRMAAKVNTEKGRQWLYSWVKEPNRYHQRTVMPELYLDPIEEKDALNKPTGKVTDPAADISAFLLGVETDWKPENVPAQGNYTAEEKKALANLAQLWLTSDAIPASRAKKYLEGTGFAESQRPKLKADERLLIGLNDANRVERQLEFVARRTIGKYGCFGCHDIPGFEDAKPIGTALVDWGRKETSKLAFENIHKFLETHHINPKNPGEPASAGGEPSHDAASTEAHAEGEEHAVAHGHLDPADFDDKDSYFVQSLNSHGRDGFLWQKLRYPRSFDYKTTRNKNYNERLRMPKFPFNDQQREAIMTFVLGLVKEPPASKYIFRPDPRQKAIVDGRQVLERFNCAGCHTLQQEQWQFDYASDTFEDASEVVDYPFLAPRFTEQQIAESLAKDYRGMQHASVMGHPVFNEETGKTQLVDQDRAPITLEELAEAEAEEGEEIPVFYQFTLWRNELINGQPRLRGVDELLIPADREKYGPANGDAFPAWGGDLARYLFPKVIAKAKEKNPQVIAREAWGWLPPPLMDEGKKVQTDWLHGFLLDPYALRPAAVMRMPNFHMSSEDAAKLVDFFAASSDAPFPYEYKLQQRASYLTKMSAEREDPLVEAMNIVTNGNYCVKCHAVADFAPEGDPNTFGPNLADAYRRLRPEFTRDWIANPARILPYTGMPVNISYRPDDPHMGGVAQNLFEGSSVQQLTGVVDLLMNFDAYARGNTSVTPLVQQAQAEAAAAAAQQGAAPAGGAGVGDDPARSESTNPLRNAPDAEGSNEPTQ
ncbi:MAG: c-type cytochrome [Pirellulales bacterium]|nr:c-type cytochrome [Pirellulales bacterium]